MEISTIDASQVAKMFLAGAKNLEAKKEWINELNVFPVPDGDTGTNMSMTIMSAAREVSALDNPDMKSLCKAISSGSLRGARGNSGVILSQLLRGFTKGVAEYDEIDVMILSEALQKAVDTAYKAVMKPKEGTILTVAKAGAHRALELAEETDDLVYFVSEVIKEADRMLQKTPDMLPVLKQAGVVDSGGQGLVEVLKGANDALLGKEIDYTIEGAASAGTVTKITPQAEADIKFGYCTEFIIMLNKPMTDKQERDFKSYLESIGDSIVVVADDEITKVHVHTNDPGLAIQRALTYGALSRMKIDNMREEHQEKLIKDAEKLAQQQKEEEEEAKKQAEQEGPVEEKDMAFISVSIGEGINEIFRSLGVDEIIEGGQTMNPATEDILAAIQSVPAKTVFVLPNNKNIIMAAEQAQKLADRQVVVLPTRTVPMGITAMLNFDPSVNAETNTINMMAAADKVSTGLITYAARDSEYDGKRIKKGEIMALENGKIVSTSNDITKATYRLARGMCKKDSSFVTIISGCDVSDEDAEKVTEIVKAKCPNHVEVSHIRGGQPVYYYMISVE